MNVRRISWLNFQFTGIRPLIFLTNFWFLCRKVRRILLAIVTTMTLSSTPKTWPRSTLFFHTPTDVSYLKNRNWIPLSMLRWACWCQGFWKDHLRGKPYHIRYVLSLCARQKHSNLWLDCRIYFLVSRFLIWQYLQVLTSQFLLNACETCIWCLFSVGFFS